MRGEKEEDRREDGRRTEGGRGGGRGAERGPSGNGGKDDKVCPYSRISGKNNIASTTSSRTDPDDDVVDDNDVALYSALDVVEVETLHPRRH